MATQKHPWKPGPAAGRMATTMAMTLLVASTVAATAERLEHLLPMPHGLG
jgi:hypothetical protein